MAERSDDKSVPILFVIALSVYGEIVNTLDVAFAATLNAAAIEDRVNLVTSDTEFETDLITEIYGG